MEQINQLCPLNFSCEDYPDDEIIPEHCGNRHYCSTVGRALPLPYRVNYRYLEVEITPISDEHSGVLEKDVDTAYRKELKEHGWAEAETLPFYYVSNSDLPFPVLVVSFSFIDDDCDLWCDKYTNEALAEIESCGWAEATFIPGSQDPRRLRGSYTLDHYNHFPY